MLVLSRKVGDKIMIGDNITVVVNKVAGNRISLGIQAPDNVRIVRGELAEIVKAFDEEEAPSEQPGVMPGPTFDLSSDLSSDPVIQRAR